MAILNMVVGSSQPSQKKRKRAHQSTTSKVSKNQSETDVGERVEPEAPTEVWNAYQCSLNYGVPHPGSTVESMSLAVVPLPPITYPLHETLLLQIQRGLLSNLQLEGIAAACARHLKWLPDGKTRAGFFVGDSAGVGKGRQLAGLILDNLCRGRPRHAWFSASKDLYKDALRDLKDVACSVPVFEDIASLSKPKPKAVKEGVAFSTYAGLVYKQRGGGANRMNELVAWLCNGKPEAEFDGLLVFDESHKAKNYNENASKTTAVGTAVVALQQRLPKARVVYASATGVSDVDSVGYFLRLGIFGPGTPFETLDDFKKTFGSSSTSVLEL